SILIIFFFFQAEDGIRDDLVTGVQTCAFRSHRVGGVCFDLAQTRFRIWFEIEAHASDAMAELGIIPKEAAWTIWEKAKNAKFDRSEERRVGKEGKERRSK